MLIRKWESLLEKHIEGFFNKKFASALEFAEIEKYLEREMRLKKKKTEDVFLLPNAFYCYIGEADFEKFKEVSFKEKMYVWAICFNIIEDCVIEGHLKVEFRQDHGLKKGQCEWKSFFEDEAEYIAPKEKMHTIVMEQPAVAAAVCEEKKQSFASLTVLEGPDQNACLEMGQYPVHIGRRMENEFSLSDKNISRMHAYISFEKYRHFLYDSGSLNGTYVNGRRVKSCRLLSGDEIRIGNTLMVYEVI